MNRNRAAGPSGGETPAKRQRHYGDDEIVQKQLRDYFSEFGPDETDVRRGPDGRALREKLLYGMEMARSGAVKVVFGARYYRDLKIIYRNPTGVFTGLISAKQYLSISPSLLRAITDTKRSPADWTLIQ